MHCDAPVRILPAAPVNTRPRTPLISFCTVQLQTLCDAHSLATLYLFTTSGPDPREFLGFWGSMVFRHASIPRKESGKQQQHAPLHHFNFQVLCGIIWGCANKSRFYCVKRTLILDSCFYFLLTFIINCIFTIVFLMQCCNC